jgi:hypothetical protein
MKPSDYLKRYADRYKVKRDECGDYNIQTRMRSRRAPDLPLNIWVYNDALLACWVPDMGKARRLQAKYSCVTIEGDCDEVVEIRFPEEDLHLLAKVLKVVRIHQRTEAQKKAAMKGLRAIRNRKILPKNEGDHGQNMPLGEAKGTQGRSIPSEAPFWTTKSIPQGREQGAER